MNDVVKKKKHLGRTVGLIRESRGMKQEELANRIGTSQQTVSKYEQSEELEEKLLEKLAKGLGVEVEYILEYNATPRAKVINNTFNTKENTGSIIGSNDTVETMHFNPVSELVAAYKDQLKNMQAMYERMLEEKDKQIQDLKNQK
jgi:transcriptional regulator with XRE-family HTH domain